MSDIKTTKVFHSHPLTAEKQYIDLCYRTLAEGVMIPNQRTGVGCLTVINADITIDVGDGDAAVLTTRKMNWQGAIAEFLGYLKGFTSAADFRQLGTKTWDDNANINKAWLANEYRAGGDDMGKVYGAVATNWPKHNGETIDTFRKVYENLKAGKDDRGEIITFWNPGEFELGCLRPCMHSHQFSILGDTLYLNSTQRSADLLLGSASNIIQAAFFLQLMAHITGLKPGKVYLKMVNAHIYENQLPVFVDAEQGLRKQYAPPQLIISDDIKTWDDVVNEMTTEHVDLINYFHHEPIKYPFTV